MNKDKAIQLLERLQDPEPYEPMLTKDAYDAIQMAIDALSADGDTISRKAAIGALVAETIYTEEELREYYEANSHRNEWVNGIYEAVEAIKQLPPAQPEQLSTNLAEVGTDCCISRQVAIDAMAELQGRASTKAELKGISKAWKRIKQLPPIQPKRIRGRWSIKGQAIDTVRGYWAKCSACGHSVFGGGNYCSYCGSYNKGEVME